MIKLIDAVKTHPYWCIPAAVCAVALAVAGCYMAAKFKTVPERKQCKKVDCECTTATTPVTPVQEKKDESPKHNHPHRPKSYTREQALDMKNKLEEGWRKVAIAKFYNISSGTVTNAIKSVS